MSNISSVGGYSSAMTQGMHGMKRPDSKQMAENLFSKLDTSGQGYLSKSDLETAFNKVSDSSSSSSNVDDLFSKLDSNGDGKVTKQEFTDTLSKLADQLANGAMQSGGGMPGKGMGGGMSGMGMPPMGGMGGMPPGGNDGLTKDQLSSLADQTSGTSSDASSKISDLLKNFDKADTNGDGKVSFTEAMTYQQSQSSDSSSSSSSTSTSSDTSSATTSTTSDNSLRRMIMQLMQAYSVTPNGNNEASVSSLSVTA